MIDVTPGIKIQPVRWIIKKIGSLLNAEIKEEMDGLKKEVSTLKREFTTHKIESWRYEILDFANSCMNHKKHTKEEFDHILQVHNEYERYIEENKLENGQVDIAHEYIKEIYMHCMKTNSFLSGKPEEHINNIGGEKAQ